MENYQAYILPTLVFVFIIWKIINAIILRKKISEFKSKNAIIIDVRTKEEFQTAANPRSQNIPLDQIQVDIKNFKLSQPIIVCCASGYRSGVAAKIIQRQGFQSVLNGGSWRNVR